MMVLMAVTVTMVVMVTMVMVLMVLIMTLTGETMSYNPESGPLSLTMNFIAHPCNFFMNSDSPVLGPTPSCFVVINGWLCPYPGGLLAHWRWVFTLVEGKCVENQRPVGDNVDFRALSGNSRGAVRVNGCLGDLYAHMTQKTIASGGLVSPLALTFCQSANSPPPCPSRPLHERRGWRRRRNWASQNMNNGHSRGCDNICARLSQGPQSGGESRLGTTVDLLSFGVGV